MTDETTIERRVGADWGEKAGRGRGRRRDYRDEDGVGWMRGAISGSHSMRISSSRFASVPSSVLALTLISELRPDSDEERPLAGATSAACKLRIHQSITAVPSKKFVGSKKSSSHTRQDTPRPEIDSRHFPGGARRGAR